LQILLRNLLEAGFYSAAAGEIPCSSGCENWLSAIAGQIRGLPGIVCSGCSE
jgi:hypothetical protein